MTPHGFRKRAEDLQSVEPRTPEFPSGADTAPLELTRRDLMMLLGASAALAGAEGCDRGPPEFIVPYVRTPPGVTPSVPSEYATTMTIGGYGVGMVVESHEGRPTKVEGNPAHSSSGGALGTLEQASILGLYDPTRARSPLCKGQPTTWRRFAEAIAAPSPSGQRVHVLLEPTSGPHIIDLVRRARARGDVVVHYDAPVSPVAAWDGARSVFGRPLDARPRFERADVVMALDDDFLGASGSPMAWAYAWAQKRRLVGTHEMSRLYSVGPRLTVTAMSADERLRVQSREVRAVATDVLAQVILLGTGDVPESVRGAAKARAPGPYARWVDAVARDLVSHGRASLVTAGQGQPPEVHALAHALNFALRSVGNAVTYGPPPIHEAGEKSHGLTELVRAIDAREVSTLIIVGGNPAYTAAADYELTRRLGQIPVAAFVGLYENETARACAWFAPEAHFLEAWSDARSFDGKASIVQPLIETRYEGKTAAQVLSALIGAPDETSLQLVQSYWRGIASQEFPHFWQRGLVRGWIDEESTTNAPVFDWSGVIGNLSAPSSPRVSLELVYFADAKVHDGRFGNNAWLQELADPVTKLTWDNAALLSPKTAERMSLANEDVVTIQTRGRTLRAPVLVIPMMADDVAAIALGYGQTIPDRVSYEVGANAYLLRDSKAPWFAEATLSKTGAKTPLALTQEHWSMEGRPIVLTRTLAEYRRDPDFARPQNERPRTLYEFKPKPDPSRPNGGTIRSPQWGMTIDLNACTGCSACVVACMAENNIPVVGKDGVRLSREMQWLRLDRYFGEENDDPPVVVQPMLCQHCEKAPCEYVCPVNATVHSPDGLNEMVYNRCVGTRFCSNNCPYKVRRFNFFNYNAGKDESLKLAMNPDVTVRARGVMEKCTYCVQRIREVEIRARREERPIRDGEVVTACAQTCPTGAIVFGDIADPSTRVSESLRSDRAYQVLAELGTVPRTRYLARIVNPNPEIHSS